MSELTPHQTLVYKELAERLLCQFLPNYEFYKTSVVMSWLATVGSGRLLLSRMERASLTQKEEKDERPDGNVPVVVLGSIENKQVRNKTSTMVVNRLYC